MSGDWSRLEAAIRLRRTLFRTPQVDCYMLSCLIISRSLLCLYDWFEKNVMGPLNRLRGTIRISKVYEKLSKMDNNPWRRNLRFNLSLQSSTERTYNQRITSFRDFYDYFSALERLQVRLQVCISVSCCMQCLPVHSGALSLFVLNGFFFAISIRSWGVIFRGISWLFEFSTKLSRLWDDHNRKISLDFFD